MARTVAISTNKGGVLKTSLTTNFAGVISRNYRVLIVDTDNQGNCMVAFGKDPDGLEVTLYDALVDGVPAQQAIVNVHHNIDILPSNDDMAYLEFEVLAKSKKYPQPFHLLKSALAPIEKDYDFILIDTPPNLGLAQGNVLAYANEILIPFQPESFSMRSFTKIVKAITEFTNMNPSLSILGVVPTLVDTRTVLHAQVLQECRKYCDNQGIKMFDTFIPRTIRFANSVFYEGLPATLTDQRNQVPYYEQLLMEVDEYVSGKE